jgi:calcineurin-like phosphoesterase family protein
MKVKILSSFPKQTLDINQVYFSSDLHIGHEAVIKFGRKFENLPMMNYHIINEINKKVMKNDLLILLGDTMMGEKNYKLFLDNLICNNIIMLFGNHCNRSKLIQTYDKSDKLIYIGDYLELSIEKQIICCSHFPMFNWNYQDDGSFHLHGHLHGDENSVIKEIHKYRSMDVGVDSYYNMFGEYSLFSFEKVQELLKNKLIIGRHENYRIIFIARDSRSGKINTS